MLRKGATVAGNVPHLQETSLVRINQALRDLFAGRSNAVGEVTLTANDTTTAVSSLNIGPDTKVFLFPTTANAAADFGSGGLYISAVISGGFTITHPNDADTDKTFFWVALG